MTITHETSTSSIAGKIPFFVTEKVWYVFRDGEVDGPFEIRDVLKLPQISTSGAPIHVSRSGLDRWLTLKEFSDLYHAHDQFAQDHRRDISAFQRRVQEQMDLLNHLKDAPVDTTPAAKSPLIPERKHAVIPTPVTPPAAATVRPKPTVTAAKETETVREPIQLPKGNQYFLHKNKYRLGDLHSPFMVGVVKFILTLGLTWGPFLKARAYELLWHIYGKHDYRQVMPPILFSYVPGLHVIYAYRLAKLLNMAESQNQYRKTSPALAAALAILPPLAMIYLQRNINFHWKMHAKHAGFQAGH